MDGAHGNAIQLPCGAIFRCLTYLDPMKVAAVAANMEESGADGIFPVPVARLSRASQILLGVDKDFVLLHGGVRHEAAHQTGGEAYLLWASVRPGEINPESMDDYLSW